VLLDLAAGRAGNPRTQRALDHLARCRDCEAALAANTLVVHALGRLRRETQAVAPPADGWARLRSRLAAQRREPSRLLSGLPGIVTAAGLCAALVAPSVIMGDGGVRTYNEAPRGAPPPYVVFEEGRERARVAGLLPDVEIPRPYRGIRIAPPPITADLPPSSGRQTTWIEEVEPSIALAPGTTDRGGPQLGRR
jgi:hypothetical protein